MGQVDRGIKVRWGTRFFGPDAVDNIARSAELDEDFERIFGEFNGNITNFNINTFAAIAGDKLNLNNYITNDHIAAGADIDAETKLLPQSVTTAIIKDQAVTEPKIDQDAVTLSKIGPDVLTEASEGTDTAVQAFGPLAWDGGNQTAWTNILAPMILVQNPTVCDLLVTCSYPMLSFTVLSGDGDPAFTDDHLGTADLRLTMNDIVSGGSTTIVTSAHRVLSNMVVFGENGGAARWGMGGMMNGAFVVTDLPVPFAGGENAWRLTAEFRFAINGSGHNQPTGEINRNMSGQTDKLGSKMTVLVIHK